MTETVSPGLLASIARWRSAAEVIFVPSRAVITSPPVEYGCPSTVRVPVAPRSPAFTAGVPSCTWPTSTPSTSLRVEATEAGIDSTEMPRYACFACPLEMSCEAMERTVFDGTAKPTPALAPVPPAICALTPITSPWAFSSGPPELPWLMAASVWIESLIVKLFGAFI